MVANLKLPQGATQQWGMPPSPTPSPVRGIKVEAPALQPTTPARRSECGASPCAAGSPRAAGYGAAEPGCVIPSLGEQLREYGLSLGVDIGEVDDLGWVVQEAISCPLPRGWTEHTDDQGRTFFFNAVSEQSTWEHPMDIVYREVLGIVQRIREEEEQNPFSVDLAGVGLDAVHPRTTAIREHMEEIHTRAMKDLEDWSGPYDIAEGECAEYYYNESLKLSAWENPVEKWERELAIRHRVLCKCLRSRAKLPALRRLRSVTFCIIYARRLPRLNMARRSYEKDAELKQVVIDQIDCDIPRTVGRDSELSNALGVTRAMLLRHAAEDPELAYCQGMNYVGAVFAVAACSQAEAYARFKGFVKNLRGLWLPGFPLLAVLSAHFEALADSRPWFQHLCKHDVEPDMYLPQAFMALFAAWLPLSTRVLLLHQFEDRGMPGMLAVALSVMDDQGSQILQQADMDGVLGALRGLRERAPDVVALLTATEAWLPRCEAQVKLKVGSEKMQMPRLMRQGSRVFDSRGRETFSDCKPKRLSAVWSLRSRRAERRLRDRH